ncbi:MAG: ferrous iron transport protein B, partial [Succinivibrio sp.]|nr:ferrous iron transport protein B [Succinivibrio sp.]
MSNKTIALIGNQNCGKTTLFNALTGANQYVGNWPGVTVDQVIGKMVKTDCDVVDLPGLYSLSPYSAEEIVSRNFLLSDSYDVILNVVDATHLDRSLSLTLEIAPMQRPMVIALNMMDVLQGTGVDLKVSEIAEQFGCEVVPVSAATGAGLDELVAALERARVPTAAEKMFPKSVRQMLSAIGDKLEQDKNPAERYFIAASLLQNDRVYLNEYKNAENLLVDLTRARAKLEQEFNTDPETYFAQARYQFIDEVLAKARTVSKGKQTASEFSHRLDNIVTNKWLGIPLFFGVLYVIYYLAVSTVGTMATDYANDVIFGEWVPGWANALLDSAFPLDESARQAAEAALAAGEEAATNSAPEWLSSLLIDGIIGGVGAVLGFLPQMIVLFFLLSLVEQCGYMTRVAFVLDRVFRHFGLSGRSLMPIVIATGCAVPALMSTKSIDNVNERRITLITGSFLPCSAKLPIMAMIFASFFPEETYIAPLIYFIAILSIAVTGIILKKDSAFHEDVSPFVMELPDYHRPSLRNLFRTTYERSKAFVIKAGTLIFATVVVIWFLSNFGMGEEGFGMVEIDNSLLCGIGSAFAFIFIPLGFGSWQATVAAVTGLLAKENVVGTLAVLLGLGEEVAEDDATLSAALQGVFPVSAAAFA